MLDPRWTHAALFDAGLAGAARHARRLADRRVRATRYSREAAFRAQCLGEVALFSNCPVRIRPQAKDTAGLLAVLEATPRDSQAARVRVGPSQTLKHVTMREAIRRWRRGRGRLCITDFHIRGTPTYHALATSAITEFNLLAHGSEAMREQEMLTMVLSSKGAVTDSHSDDPDGTNHCFTGCKLWLAWDTFEGLAAGLEDCERSCDSDFAAFDLGAFSRLRSARWWLVEPGQTLFLPGHLTHRVITLEDYVGVGSFHVSLPGALRTLSRWAVHGPLWEHADESLSFIVDDISRCVVRQVGKLSEAADASLRERWGYDFLPMSLRAFEKASDDAVRAKALSQAAFRDAHGAVQAIARRRQAGSRTRWGRVEAAGSRSL